MTNPAMRRVFCPLKALCALATGMDRAKFVVDKNRLHPHAKSTVLKKKWL
jgi:hypothetical protein